MFTLNTNSYVSVALTDKGKSVLNDYMTNKEPELAIQLRDLYKDNNDGRLTMQLHKLMLIFGSSCWVGNKNLFKDNIIHIDEKCVSASALEWKQEGEELRDKLINLHDDGKRKWGSIEANTTIRLPLHNGCDSDIEFVAYDSSEKDAVDSLIVNVEKSANVLNELLQQLRSERDKTEYSDKNVTIYSVYD